MKKIIILVGLLLLLNISNVGAKCSYSEISRMKSLVNNINISYDYKIENGVVKFNITLTNLTSDMYFYDSTKNKNYYYSDTNDGEIVIQVFGVEKGTYNFFSANPSCYATSLGKKYYKLPIYNNYYDDPLCEDIKNFGLCQKWVNNNYNYSEFKQLVYDYKDSLDKETEEKLNIVYEKTLLDKIVQFYINYYYIILISIITICVIVIVIERRKNMFKL